MTTKTTLSNVDAGAGACVGVRAVLDAEVEAEAGAAEQHAPPPHPLQQGVPPQQQQV